METKTFENGIMRLSGLSNYKVSGMIILQASMFVLPSIVFSMICIVPLLLVITSALNLETSPVPSGGAVAYATFLGLLIPVLSSIPPVRKALSMNIVSSLGSNRSYDNALKGSVISISSSFSLKLAPLVTFGVLAVSFGCMLFYGMPYALISGSYSVLLSILFAVLISLILGLTLIAYNLQSVLEIAYTKLLLQWWEKKSTINLLRKNLVSHKKKNQLTALIYALSIAIAIFLLVSLTLVLKESSWSHFG
jgi:ABC-type antimicrobial peptide transport system permease subunit